MSESNESDIMYHGAEWFEKYKSMLLFVALAVIVAAVGTQFYMRNTGQTKAASESALFAVQNESLTNLVEIAEAYSRVSTEHVGKPVAERALILSAKTWLEAANYDKAQSAFESYFRQHKNGHWAAEAELGQAICQEAKGDAAAAISTYQSLTNNTSAAIQKRATALLEAAQIKLEPLAVKPKPVPVLQPEVPKPATPTTPPAPVGPDSK